MFKMIGVGTDGRSVKRIDVSLTSKRNLENTSFKGSNRLDCLICFDVLEPTSRVWSCRKCFSIFHLDCINQWAMRDLDLHQEECLKVWKCPVCRLKKRGPQREFLCMCGKTVNPKLKENVVPFTCGLRCQRMRDSHCPHKCKSLCHLGPCPPCNLFFLRECFCGKYKQKCQCSSVIDNKQPRFISCKRVCGKTLSCGVCKCLFLCHGDYKFKHNCRKLCAGQFPNEKFNYLQSFLKFMFTVGIMFICIAICDWGKTK